MPSLFNTTFSDFIPIPRPTIPSGHPPFPRFHTLHSTFLSVSCPPFAPILSTHELTPLKSSLPSMYPNPSQPSAVQGQGQQPNQQTQQRNPSNPRTYPAADPNAIAGERRTDSLPYPPQPGGHQYPQYGQQAGYSGGYQYDATAMG
jgi:hypothetical protein